MILEFAAAYQSLRTLVQLATTAHDAVTQVEVNKVLIEMQGTVLDLQSQLSAVQARMDDLAEAKRAAEAKLVENENWEKEAAKYQLKMVARGAAVMALKPGVEGAGPQHWLCPNCFEKQVKSYLCRSGGSMIGPEYSCAVCEFAITSRLESEMDDFKQH